MLDSPEIRNVVQFPIFSPDGAIKDCIDADYAQNSDFFADGQKIMVAAYYDDIEVVNPIGSKRKKHKIALFYWTLLNVPPQHRSQLKFIHLFAVAYSADVKEYGVQAILLKFAEEINVLKKDGIEVVNRDGKDIYKGSLLFFIGDTPAANMVAGFKEGVGGAAMKCRTCYGSSQEIIQQFNHTEFRLRDIESHRRHCLLLGPEMPARQRVEYSKRYGINSLSILDKIDGFDVCQCIPVDIMHIVCEGTLPYAIKGFVSRLLENRIISISSLNEHIKNFPYRGDDKKNAPSSLERSCFNGLDTGKIGQSATQTICLGFLLPLILAGHNIEEIPEYRLLLMMVEITSVLLAYSFNKDQITTAATLIKLYLETWVTVYGAHTITPKMHYLVHIPYYIVKFGLPRGTWCLRMEAKHAFFKSLRMRNFKNVPLSLSNRHQLEFCHDWADANVHGVLHHNNAKTKGARTAEDSPEPPEHIQESLGDCTQCCNTITISGFRYSIGDAFRLASDTYGVILQIVANNDYITAFLLEEYKAEWFEARLFAHKLQCTGNFVWRLVSSLPHHHPLYVYKLPPFQPACYIQPRYFSDPEFVDTV
ncbi:uncharacterized protein [Watersipora subatra]